MTPRDPIDKVRDVLSAPEDIELHEGAEAAAYDAGDDQDDDAAGDYDLNDPGPAPGPEDADGGLPPEEEAQLIEASLHPLNDYGNGLRFVTYFGDDVLQVPRVGWYTWTGKVWQHDPDSIAIRGKAQLVSEKIELEVPYLTLEEWKMDKLKQEAEIREQLLEAQDAANGDPKDLGLQAKAQDLRNRMDALIALKKTLGTKRSEHRKFAKSSGNTGKINALLTEGGIKLSKSIDLLDADELVINTESGVVTFQKVVDEFEAQFAKPGDPPKMRTQATLVPHDRSQMITKCMPVHFDPKAKCPQFDAFLEEVQPDPKMRAFILRWLGLSMTAIPVQLLSFWYGGGANGKSVLSDLVSRILDGYASKAKIKSLTGVDRRGGGDATPDLMLLIGARMVTASEPKEGEALQEDLIKELTGGEPFLVRNLHSDFVEFRPYFKLTIQGNHKPTIRGTDDGIWRRMMLVPWNVQIPEERRDKKLTDRLFAEERDGIFNRLLQGLVDYLDNGIQVPEAVMDATQEFRAESDPVGEFLNTCCEITGEGSDSIRVSDLVMAFNYWLVANGGTEFRPRTVQNRLKDKAGRWKSRDTGYSFRERKSSVMFYDGLRLTEDFGRMFREAPRDQQGRIIQRHEVAE